TGQQPLRLAAVEGRQGGRVDGRVGRGGAEGGQRRPAGGGQLEEPLRSRAHRSGASRGHERRAVPGQCRVEEHRERVGDQDLQGDRPEVAPLLRQQVERRRGKEETPGGLIRRASALSLPRAGKCGYFLRLAVMVMNLTHLPPSVWTDPVSTLVSLSF